MGQARLTRNLSEALGADQNHERQAWARALPETIETLSQRWSLVVGAPFEPGGATAWVAPARTERDEPVILKVAWRHTEAMHEADGLHAWAGRGTVALLESHELGDTVGLLLERCLPGTPLAERPEPEQDEVIGSLLPRLWLEPPAGHPFRPLQDLCDLWADGFEATDTPSALDPGLAHEGIALFRALPGTADREVLLCTDLHAGNVLASARAPWLAIDPKPYVGDPAYDAVQHLLNCEERLVADPRALVRRVAGLLGLDPARLQLWLFARCVVESPGWPAMAQVAATLGSHR
jgi:streptomycin 6-kinase